MKSGGGTPNAPADAQPNIHNTQNAQGVTPYGQASPFNPMYDSILPMNGAPAQLTDRVRQEGGGAVPLQAQQAAEIAAQQAAAQQAALNPVKNELTPREKFIQLLNSNKVGVRGAAGFGDFGMANNSRGGHR